MTWILLITALFVLFVYSHKETDFENPNHPNDVDELDPTEVYQSEKRKESDAE